MQHLLITDLELLLGSEISKQTTGYSNACAMMLTNTSNAPRIESSHSIFFS
jgi:hypothetical protein